jgi:hypothetical protein
VISGYTSICVVGVPGCGATSAQSVSGIATRGPRRCDDLGGRVGVAAAAGIGGAGGQRLRGGRAGEDGQGEGDSELG